MPDAVTHSFTHRPKAAGGTDPLEREKVYVGTFVDVDDPGNDPYDPDNSITTNQWSPEWLNGFTYQEGAPVWFAFGIDGELDMGGMYDLVTGSPASGTIAFMMPNEWAVYAPALSQFLVVTTAEADPADDVIITACQRIDQDDPEATLTDVPVRIYWPIYATALP